MPWPLVRIDLDERSRDFQRVALQPGFPLLDRVSANSHIVRQWLGRFAADPVWDNATVRFLLHEDQNAAPPTDLIAASLSDLHGALRKEVETLQTQLKNAAPRTANERALLGALRQQLDKALAGDAAVPGLFFQYKGQGGRKLVWCWGYERRQKAHAPLRVCQNSDCRLAYFEDAETRQTCPRCLTKQSSSRLRPLMMSAALLLIVTAAGFFGWKSLAPGVGTVEGDVIDAITGAPIANVELRPLGEAKPDSPMPQATHTDATGRFRVPQLPQQLPQPPRWEVTATGYQSATWEVPTGKSAAERPRILLRGAADASGLIVEEGSDRPIPFAKVQLTKSRHETTGDDLGLFLLPGVPSGKMEVEVTADGYRTLRLEREFAAGHDSDWLISMTGAAVVSGKVVDAFDRRPVPGAMIRLLDGLVEIHADGQGQFHREALPGKSCRFEVSAPGYFTREFDRDLSSASETSLRFLLRPELISMEGLVVDSSNTPIELAEVKSGGDRLPLKTASDGRFSLSSLRRGQLSLQVSANGYRLREIDVTVPTDGHEPTRIVLKGSAKLVGLVSDAVRKSPIAGAEVRVADGRWKGMTNERGEVEIADLPAGNWPVEVIGRGYRAAQSQQEFAGEKETRVAVELRGATVLSGTVAAAFNQQPLADAEVRLEGVAVPTKTDAEGRFRFEDVVAGPTMLTVSAQGFRPVTLEQPTRADEETRLPVLLIGAATLRGRVLKGETDQAVAQANVTLAGTDRKLSTNDQGEFELAELPARRFQVTAAADGFAPEQIEIDLGEMPLPMAVFRLQPPHAVHGVVLDARSRKPIQGASVSMSGRAEPAITDAEGRFQFIAARAPSYEFAVTAAGYPPQSFVERPGVSREPEAVFQLPLQVEGEQPTAGTSAEKPEEKPAVTPEPKPTTTPNPETQPRSPDDFGLPPSRPRDPLEVEFFGARTKASQVGFVVDNSGSMSGDRLKRTKIELLKAVLNLHPKQTFYVAFFNDQPVPMFGGDSPPLAASPVNKVRAYKWMTTIEATGGTDPQATLQMVAKMSPQAIFLLTDGGFSPLGEDTFAEFQKHNTRVNTLAFEDESGKAVLQGIAQRTQGTYRFVPAAPLCETCELSLVTALFDELLESWLDPKTDASEARAAHVALIEFCDGQDFGPRAGAADLERRRARTHWQGWWVENKLAPSIRGQDEARLLRNFQNPNSWWRWAAVEAARQKGLSDVGPFISKVRDTVSGVNQAARRALVAVAKDEDYGPPEDADPEASRVAHDQWTEWWRRERHIASLAKRGDDLLAHEFSNPDLKTRRAALRAAADRGNFSLPDPLIERLNDDDEQVRRNANEALTKVSGKSFDPSGGRDRASSSAAAKEYRKWRNAKVEKEADQKFQLAERLEKSQRTDAAKQWYQRVAESFPNTEAGAKAAKRAKSLSQ